MCFSYLLPTPHILVSGVCCSQQGNNLPFDVNGLCILENPWGCGGKLVKPFTTEPGSIDRGL